MSLYILVLSVCLFLLCDNTPSLSNKNTLKWWQIPIKAVLTLFSADYTLQEMELKQILWFSYHEKYPWTQVKKKKKKNRYSPFTLSFWHKNSNFLFLIRCKILKISTLRILGQLKVAYGMEEATWNQII